MRFSKAQDHLTNGSVDVLEPQVVNDKPRPSLAGPGPIAPAPMLPTPKRRQRRGLMAAGVLLVVLFAAAAWWLSNTATQRISVVGVSRDVALGQVIGQSDLQQVQIVRDPGLTTVPWTDMSTVVGERAAVDLLAGSLITPKSATTATVPRPGQALVGVSVKAAQLPVTPLQSGDSVELILTPGTNAQEPGAATVVVLPAKVFTVGSPDASGARTVDVLVDLTDSAKIAVASQQGQVAIVLVPRS